MRVDLDPCLPSVDSTSARMLASIPPQPIFSLALNLTICFLLLSRSSGEWRPICSYCHAHFVHYHNFCNKLTFYILLFFQLHFYFVDAKCTHTNRYQMCRSLNLYPHVSFISASASQKTGRKQTERMAFYFTLIKYNPFSTLHHTLRFLNHHYKSTINRS